MTRDNGVISQKTKISTLLFSWLNDNDIHIHVDKVEPLIEKILDEVQRGKEEVLEEMDNQIKIIGYKGGGLIYSSANDLASKLKQSLSPKEKETEV